MAAFVDPVTGSSWGSDYDVPATDVWSFDGNSAQRTDSNDNWGPSSYTTCVARAFEADQYAKVTFLPRNVPVGGSGDYGVGVGVRLNRAQNRGYYIQLLYGTWNNNFNEAQLIIYVRDAGGTRTLRSMSPIVWPGATPTPLAPITLEARIEGTVLTVLLNGVEYDHWDDTASQLTSGAPGFWLQNGNGHRIDQFEADDIVEEEPDGPFVDPITGSSWGPNYDVPAADVWDFDGESAQRTSSNGWFSALFHTKCVARPFAADQYSKLTVITDNRPGTTAFQAVAAVRLGNDALGHPTGYSARIAYVSTAGSYNYSNLEIWVPDDYGARQILPQTNISPWPGAHGTFTLEIRVVGAQITVFVNDVQVAQVTDPTPLTHEGVPGFWMPPTDGPRIGQFEADDVVSEEPEDQEIELPGIVSTVAVGAPTVNVESQESGFYFQDHFTAGSLDESNWQKIPSQTFSFGATTIRSTNGNGRWPDGCTRFVGETIGEDQFCRMTILPPTEPVGDGALVFRACAFVRVAGTGSAVQGYGTSLDVASYQGSGYFSLYTHAWDASGTVHENTIPVVTAGLPASWYAHEQADPIVLEIRIEGTTLTVLINDVVMSSGTPATVITGGTPGFGLDAGNLGVGGDWSPPDLDIIEVGEVGAEPPDGVEVDLPSIASTSTVGSPTIQVGAASESYPPVLGYLPDYVPFGSNFALVAEVPESAGVSVDPDARYVIARTSGSAFAPTLAVGGGGSIFWLFEDGTTSSSSTPNKSWSSAASRFNRLRVAPASALTGLDVASCGLTDLVLHGFSAIVDLDASGNDLDQTVVDSILGELDDFGSSNGTLDLTGNDEPSATGMAAVTALRARGWTVTVEGEEQPPVDALEVLADRAMFFAHASVGGNITEGLRDILDDNPGSGVSIVHDNNPSLLNPGVFEEYGYTAGNGDPIGKIADFDAMIRGGLGATADIAFMKFCYADIYNSTDAVALFAAYQEMIEGLKTDFPHCVFVHVTGALTVNDSNNIRREEYNGYLRAAYEGIDPIFDLAKIEATLPDGTLNIDNGVYELCPEYTYDGGHLNEIGRRHVAEELIRVLAQTPSSILPQGLRDTWNPGIPGGIPTDREVYTTLTGLSSNGTGDVGSTINTALLNAGAAYLSSGVIQEVVLPSGTFRTTQPIVIARSGVVLRGQGTSTRIRYDGSGDEALRIARAPWGTYTANHGPWALVQNALKGSMRIVVSNASGANIEVGDILCIDEEDDPSFVHMGDAQYEKRQPSTDGHGPALRGANLWRSVTSMIRVVGKQVGGTNTALTLADPLHMNFRTARYAQVWQIATEPTATRSYLEGVHWAGFEDLYVTGGTFTTNNVAFCWLKGVELDGNPGTDNVGSYSNPGGMTGRNVNLFHAYRFEMRQCYVHHSRNISQGGGAYLVSISSYTSESLVEDNIILWGNKPVVGNMMGGGNVIAYNYVDNARTSHATWQEGAIDLNHQCFTHSALVEGNWATNLVSDTTHGNAGWHVFYRNYATGQNSDPLYGEYPYTSAPDGSYRRAAGPDGLHRETTYVGNVLMAGTGTGVYQVDHTTGAQMAAPAVWRIGWGTDGDGGAHDSGVALGLLYRHGNWDSVTGSVIWNETNPKHDLPDSLYLRSKPSFFGAAVDWPWVDPTAATAGTRVKTLPAKARFDAMQQQGTPPMRLISRGVPAYASGGTASNANSANYSTPWTASQSGGAWVAYDLSGVSSVYRQRVLVYFTQNGTDRYNLDYLLADSHGYDIAGPYVIEGNAAVGGGSAPASGWVTLFTGPDPMPWKCAQHIVNFAGYNWLRFRTLRNDSNYNFTSNVSLKLDVYDADSPILDNFVFYGDSVSGEAWHSGNQFAVRVNQLAPTHFPIAEGAGVAFMTSDNGAEIIPVWLPKFLGRYCCISFGTNDCNGPALSQARLDTIRANYVTMVQAVLAAGKVPIIPTTHWSPSVQIAANLQAYNELLGVRPQDTTPPAGSLRASYPQILRGPDLYGIFDGHSEWMADNLHPNTTGYGVLQQAWADWAVENLY
jgi:lysophospholipase L1-like esterase